MSGEYTQRRKRRCTDTTTPLVYYIIYTYAYAMLRSTGDGGAIRRMPPTISVSGTVFLSFCLHARTQTHTHTRTLYDDVSSVTYGCCLSDFVMFIIIIIIIIVLRCPSVLFLFSFRRHRCLNSLYLYFHSCSCCCDQVDDDYE